MKVSDVLTRETILEDDKKVVFEYRVIEENIRPEEGIRCSAVVREDCVNLALEKRSKVLKTVIIDSNEYDPHHMDTAESFLPSEIFTRIQQEKTRSDVFLCLTCIADLLRQSC